MNGPAHHIQRYGLGLLLAGAVATAVPLPASASQSVTPSVHLVLASAPAVVGRFAELTLRLSVTTAVPVAALAVTDLLPRGVMYVPGSARLVGSGAPVEAPGEPRAPGEPSAIATIDGTLLVWSSVRVASGAPAVALLLAVQPTLVGRLAVDRLGSTAAAQSTAGTQWRDRATVYASRSGGTAPSLTAAGAPAAGALDLVATDRQDIEVVAVSAVQTGRLLTPSPAQAAQRIEERLVITSTPTGSTHHVSIRVYLPGRVTWLGCARPDSCMAPAVDQLRLPVTRAQPDQPQLPDPVATPAAATSPRSTTPALFTVLTWRLGDLAAGVTRTIIYRVDAGAITRARTLDVVTAAAIMAPVGTTGPTTAVAAGKAGRRPGGKRPRLQGGAVVRATAVQSWPMAVLPRVAALGGALNSTTSTTSTATTSPTTTPAGGPRDPFGTTPSTLPTTGTTTATTTMLTTTTTAADTTTTSTTAGRLATTGSDIVGTSELGLTLTAAGALVLLTSGIRRRRAPATGSSPPGAPAEGDR